MTQAMATLPAIPQRTAEALRAAPAPITQPVPGGGAAGVPFEKIASMQGVVQLDKLDDTHSIVISRAGANMNLEALILP